MLRNHFELGPGPQAPAGLGQSPPETPYAPARPPPLPPQQQASPTSLSAGILPPLPGEWSEEAEYEETKEESEEGKDELELED